MAREQDLTGFLQHHPIRDLKLVNISLDSGAWDNIFDYCIANLHVLHLEDLSHEFRTISSGDCKDGIEESLIKGLHKSQNTHIRQGYDSEKPIAWHVPRYRCLGSDPVVHQHTGRARNIFGPPE